jgi:Pectate lyase superfamily protein
MKLNNVKRLVLLPIAIAIISSAAFAQDGRFESSGPDTPNGSTNVGVLNGPIFNVQNASFAGGAKGDGVTDDTTAIQAAANAVIASATGGVVYFPTPLNCYRISSPILYQGGGAFSWGMRFEGADWANGGICASGALTYFFDNTSGVTASAVSWTNLHLVGGGTGTGGIHVDLVDLGTIEHVWFSNVNGYDIKIEPVAENIFTIRGNRFEHNYETNSAGINVLADWVHLDDNVFSKLINDMVTVGSTSVTPYNTMARNSHCFHCRSYMYNLIKGLEVALYESSEELDGGTPKTNQFGVNIHATMTNMHTISIYGWRAQPISGVNATYRPVQNAATASVIAAMFLGGQNTGVANSPDYPANFPAWSCAIGGMDGAPLAQTNFDNFFCDSITGALKASYNNDAFAVVPKTNNAPPFSVSLRATQQIADQGTPCTNGELALSAGWQLTGSAAVTGVNGTGQTCSWTITTGTTTGANPTITDALTNPLPSAATACEMNIHGGTHTAVAGESFQQTTLSATAPIFTFNGTPTAGGTTYFVTRRCGP